MILRSLVTLSLFAAAPLYVYAAATAAQQTLTLDAAIAEARGYSPSYKQAIAAADETSWRRLEAISGILPRMSITANRMIDVKYQVLNAPINGSVFTFPAIVPYTIVSFTGAWTFFDGLQSINSYSAAQLATEAARLDLERADLQLENEVRFRYYQAVAASLLADVAKQNVKTLQEHMQRVRDRLNEGAATKFDTLRTQVQLEEAVPEQLSAEDNVTLTRSALAQAMGLKDDTRAVEGPLPRPNEFLLDEIPELKRPTPSERADIAAAIKRSEASQKLHSASYSSWLPRLTLSASQDVYNNIDKSLNDSFRTAHTVALSLSWNIFDGGASISRQQQTYYQGVRAEAAADAAVLRAPNEVDLWRRRYAYNVQLYQARLRAVEASLESVRLAKLGYSGGTRTNTDVLDAELDFYRARAGVVRSQVDAAEALINLELALGKRLPRRL